MPTSLIQGNHPIRDEDGSSSRRSNTFGPALSSQPLGQSPRNESSSQADLARLPAVSGNLGSQQGQARPLQNRPIRSKVALILVVPLVALLLFAGVRINDSRIKAQAAEDLNELGKLSISISSLTHELQQERGRVSNVLAGSDSPESAGLFAQGKITDEAVDEFRDLASGTELSEVADVSTRVDKVLDQIGRLNELRKQVANPAARLPSGEATFRYSAIISDLLAIVEAISQISTNDNIGNHMRALANFARYKEFAAQESFVMYEVLLGSKFEPGQYRDFINTLANQEAYLVQFRQRAPNQERRKLEEKMTRAELAAAIDLETIAVRSENADPLGITVQEWLNAMSKKSQLMRDVEKYTGNAVLHATTELRDEAIQNSLVEAAAVLLALVIAITISLLIARSMVRPLVRLRTSALEVAYQRLPEVVRRLRDVENNPTAATGVDPVAEARSVTHGVDVSSSDEIGQVAQAFNAVHHEAVRVATEQAQLRQSVAAMFVNLARRSQRLVDHLIRLIDKLEQSERDPDRLAELFRLDHLATRMRRNDENLLVLAGAEGGRRWSASAALLDVLRAAIAEVEQYTRVKIGHVDKVEISAKAVNDVVHLVAELLENATAFSSPRTEVLVDARLVASQVVIEIEDQGIGMSTEQLEQLNERLAKPPVLDVTVSRMMGLFVVGRLATRHGIRVMLRTSSGGGVLAIVTLPYETLLDVPPPAPALPPAERGKTGQHPLPALPPGTSTPPVPPQRSGSEHSGEFAVPVHEGEVNGELGKTGSGHESAIGTPTHTPTQWRYQPSADADPTVEMTLPIFEQIESEWFRPPTLTMSTRDTSAMSTREPTSDQSTSEQSTSEPSDHQSVILPQRIPNAEVAPPPPGPAVSPGGSMPAQPGYELANGTRHSATEEKLDDTILDDSGLDDASLDADLDASLDASTAWRTAADSGWQRAEEVAEPTVGDTTLAGLPKRVPMANFVPGAVEQPTARQQTTTHRSPDAVRGVLSSYRRGIEQGRQAGRSRHAAVVTEDNQEEK